MSFFECGNDSFTVDEYLALIDWNLSWQKCLTHFLDNYCNMNHVHRTRTQEVTRSRLPCQWTIVFVIRYIRNSIFLIPAMKEIQVDRSTRYTSSTNIALWIMSIGHELEKLWGWDCREIDTRRTENHLQWSYEAMIVWQFSLVERT
jgi:hypothetical protein